MPEPQADIDARVLAYYGDGFDERARLTTRSAQGPLELGRTLELIRAHGAGRRMIDIGGGPGRYAEALLAAGHAVEVVDPVQRHVEQATGIGVSARLGDARALPFADDSFDAALLLGPLYHLADRHDRLRALAETARVVRDGGLVFASGISRLVAFAALFAGSTTGGPLPPELVAILDTGTPPPGLRFPAGHFHTPEELQQELELAGLAVREVVGIEGPAGLLLETVTDADPSLVDAATTIARRAADRPGVRDFSQHLLAVAEVRKPEPEPPL